LISAPPLETPVPFNVSGMAVLNVIPFRSRVPPAVTEVLLVDPNAVILLRFRIPALMVVVPV